MLCDGKNEILNEFQNSIFFKKKLFSSKPIYILFIDS